MLAMPSSRYIFGSLPWYSMLMVCAICVAILLSCREEKRLGLPKDTTVDLALWLIPFGIVGARLYYVVFAWDTFADNPISVLYVWQGGLAIYGAVIGGVLAAYLFSRRRKLPLLKLCDMVAPGLILAQAIGRWGNYFNMEAYGLAITDPAWQFFPAGVLIREGGVEVWHMATFFYESMWNLGVFAALMLGRRKMRRSGDVLCWYALLYGGGRLILEGLRLDSLMSVGGSARVSQLLSVIMCLCVFVYFAYHTLKPMDRRTWCIGGAAGVAALVVTLLLPRPAEAFFGYNIAFIAQVVIVCAVLAMLVAKHQIALHRRLWLLLPFLSVVFATMVRVHLASGGITGYGASTLLCALFTLSCITSAVCVYPAASKEAAHTATPE